MQRNDYIETVQGNRNPFIDNPYLATLIWGGVNAQDTWNLNTTVDEEAPSTPTSVTATNITDDSAVISWGISTDNIAVVDYQVYVNSELFGNTSNNTITLDGLSGNTTYTVSVIARDAANNQSAASVAIEFTTLQGPVVLFEEDFNDCNTVQFFSYNEQSDKNWICYAQFGENNSGSMGMNGHQQDALSKDWLITKDPIDFDQSEDELLSFYTDAAYGSSVLELVYSSDYDGIGDPSAFTWTPVPNVTIPTHSSGQSNEEVFVFNDVDVSSIAGAVYMAFKYYSNEEPTRWTVDSFKLISFEVDDDLDDDGVLNDQDLCPNTPIGENVDANGCSYGQLDDDGDGVQNSDDLCADTPDGAAVNSGGCAESQLDDDEDGITNDIDLCANTPNGESVDASGCSEGQRDDDNDGIQNSDDLCGETPNGSSVDENGCAESQKDDDGDGITNDIDTCPETDQGAQVNNEGCAEYQLDDDNDGVSNDVDICPDTPSGSNVNSEGCVVFSLPADNFTIETISETCPDKNNGQLKISANESHAFEVTIDGIPY